MAMILESTPNGTDEWFRRYREKYQADAAAMHRGFFDAEYPISDIDPAKPGFDLINSSGIDPAKPGSDRTEVFVWPRCTGKSAALKALEQCEAEFNDWYRLQLNLTMKTLPAVKVEIAPPPAPPPVPDTDRMWDMLVLAARASRYGG